MYPTANPRVTGKNVRRSLLGGGLSSKKIASYRLPVEGGLAISISHLALRIYEGKPSQGQERPSLLEGEGKVGYRHGEKGAELETMDYLEFIARVRVGGHDPEGLS